ncbi:MAG: hypothetical protein KC502_20185 [Myxococcales bacterium]|nr:hypothetical protein [Myxococcales bacterium]
MSSSDDKGRRAFLRGGFLRAFGRAAPEASAAAAQKVEATAARAADAAAAIERALDRGRPSDAPLAPVAPARPPAPPIPLIRPPGAVDEATFLQRCRPGCSDCAVACPVQAIRPASPRMRAAAGTPVLSPGRVPCTGCPDHDVPPCIAACPTGALHPAGSPRIGTAHVFADSCLAHRHLVCTTCRERCPVPGAIVFRAGKPEVQDKLCVGCGQCVYTCPAPGQAIAVLPLRDRPTPVDPSVPAEPSPNGEQI